jgi:dihydropteroate synthase
VIWDLKGGRQLDFRQRARIMGILNVTPDSFYDGGRYVDPQCAVDRVLAMVDEGADVVDIGGESSRPPIYGRAAQVPAGEEVDRVLPIVAAVRRQSSIPISIDTTKAGVARQALDVGADIINDISALAEDPHMVEVAVSSGAPVILMHRRGTAATMQQNTRYDDLLSEIRDFLEDRVRVAVEAGARADRLAVDPGIGFGKSVTANFALIKHLSVFARPGHPVIAVANGADMIRTHDVAATARALQVAEAIDTSTVTRGNTNGRDAGFPPTAVPATDVFGEEERSSDAPG